MTRAIVKERKCYPHDTKIEVYVYLLLNNFSVLSDFQVFLRAEMHILIFLAVVLFALPCAPSPCKGRTIRKVMVGGRSTKKNSCKGILSEKKIHARRVDQKKIPALAFHTFCTNFKKTGRKAYCVQNISSLNKLPAEFGSYQ